MHKLFNYIDLQLENNKKMKALEIYQDPIFQNEIKEARLKLEENKSFLREKMSGKTFTTSDKFDEQKSEIYNTIKSEVEGRLERGSMDWAFKHPETKTWLELFKRAEKTEFKIDRDCGQEINNILGPELPIEYGRARDLEMLYDYLTNYMSDPDALHMCESIIKFYHFGSMFAFC